MSAYPLMLDGDTLSAVIVGGGSVATRKAVALVRTGARVHVVAPACSPEMEILAANDLVDLSRETYSSSHIGDALLVIAATDDAATNSLVAADARNLGRLVNVVSAPHEGNCITPAVHAAGDVVVAVSAGGVPAAAARIRDAIAQILDARYADAIHELSVLRRRLIDSGHRERWSAAADALIGDDFCSAVESGLFVERAAEWR
jgi:siroheme synthase-like protein